MADDPFKNLIIHTESAFGGLDGLYFEAARAYGNGESWGELTFRWDTARFTDDEVAAAKQPLINGLKRRGVRILKVEHPDDRELKLHVPDDNIDQFRGTPRRGRPRR